MIKQQIFRYWLAMNASAFDAAIHSCAAFFGVAGVHAAAAAVPGLTWPQFAAVFLITFGRAILAYLDAHPVIALLPPEERRAEAPAGVAGEAPATAREARALPGPAPERGLSQCQAGVRPAARGQTMSPVNSGEAIVGGALRVETTRGPLSAGSSIVNPQS